MARVLIVHAHPAPRSFSAALAHAARAVLTAAGHEVEHSDLYAQGFDPVSDRRNFTAAADPAYFKQQVEETFATEHAGFAPELEEEMRKLERCDLLVFSFPLWWFGLPAILKGWVDRVVAYRRFYGGGVWYDRGKGRGKRAVAVLTTGGGEEMYGPLGLHPSLEDILRPIHQGVFWFNGYSPLPPFVAWSAGRVSDAERHAYLAAWRKRLPGLFDEIPAHRPPVSEFDPDTFVDLVPRFMVTVTRARPADDAYRRLVPAERERVQALRRDGLVRQAHFAPPDADPWRGFLLFRAKGIDEVRAACQAFPLAPWLHFEVDRVT